PPPVWRPGERQSTTRSDASARPGSPWLVRVGQSRAASIPFGSHPDEDGLERVRYDAANPLMEPKLQDDGAPGRQRHVVAGQIELFEAVLPLEVAKSARAPCRVHEIRNVPVRT